MKKIRFDLLDLDFCAAMCDVFETGLGREGREVNDWQTKPLDKQACLASLLRHAYNAVTELNEDARRSHLAAVACRANMIWRHTSD